ncbi:MAG: hydrolase [Methanobacteriota archaeon]
MERINGHCPRLSPDEWDGQVHAWERKPFIKDRLHMLFYVPLDQAAKIMRHYGTAYKASDPEEPVLILSRARGPFVGDILFSASRGVPAGAKAEYLSGRYYSRLWRGQHRDYKRVIGYTVDDVCERYGDEPEEILTWGATCPRCIAGNGGAVNIVVFAKIPDATGG